jgi:hypothetical protein
MRSCRSSLSTEPNIFNGEMQMSVIVTTREARGQPWSALSEIRKSICFRPP